MREGLVRLDRARPEHDGNHRRPGEAWHANDLVFCHENGTPYTSDALNWRFGKMTGKADIGDWHAREGRHTAVSIMSSNSVPIQEITDTVGHKSTRVTETVYRHVIVPAIRGGTTVMDDVFGAEDEESA
jgi:integrase